MLVRLNKNLCMDCEDVHSLEKYGIFVNNCNSLREVQLLIENFIRDNCLTDEELDFLDIILENLQERNYYENFNK